MKKRVLKKGRQRAFSEGKKEGILGGPVKRATEGTKRAKPETVIYHNWSPNSGKFDEAYRGPWGVPWANCKIQKLHI